MSIHVLSIAALIFLVFISYPELGPRAIVIELIKYAILAIPIAYVLCVLSVYSSYSDERKSVRIRRNFPKYYYGTYFILLTLIFLASFQTG